MPILASMELVDADALSEFDRFEPTTPKPLLFPLLLARELVPLWAPCSWGEYVNARAAAIVAAAEPCAVYGGEAVEAELELELELELAAAEGELSERICVWPWYW